MITLKKMLLIGTTLTSIFGLTFSFTEKSFAQDSNNFQECNTYKLSNKTNREINFVLDYEKLSLKPGQNYRFNKCYTPRVMFDSILGQGYRLKKVELTPGNNAFDLLDRKNIILGTGSINNPDIVTPNDIDVPFNMPPNRRF